jgi:hypothetical protein
VPPERLDVNGETAHDGAVMKWSAALPFGLVLTLAPDAGAEPPSFLGPAGLLAEGRHAVFVSADTELPGYPAVELGWRYGLGFGDVGLELQAIDVAIAARLHAKIRVYEDPRGRGFLGFRLRFDFKRQVQAVDPDTFRDIDDFGPVLAPEFSAAMRFGAERNHAIHYFTYFYLDFDVRSGEPPFEAYYAPVVVGYEWRHESGFHFVTDTGVGVELGNPDTYGELIPRIRARLGWEF